MNKSELEETFALHLKAEELPEPVREHKFHPFRNWRFDFAWLEYKLAVEIEGGTWMEKGRHTSGSGFEKDTEKYNAAALMGWTVLRFTASGVHKLLAIQTTKTALIERMKNDFLFEPEVTK